MKVKSKINRYGDIIRDEREAAQITIQELAKRAQVPYTTLYQIESGKVTPQIATYEKICRALGYELVLLPFESHNKKIKEN